RPAVGRSAVERSAVERSAARVDAGVGARGRLGAEARRDTHAERAREPARAEVLDRVGIARDDAKSLQAHLAVRARRRAGLAHPAAHPDRRVGAAADEAATGHVEAEIDALEVARAPRLRDVATPGA